MVNQALIISVLKITVIDLVLSGDNAVVIAMAIKNLPTEVRTKAAIAGASVAVGLRIAFTAAAAMLLHIPYLQSIGGVVLFWIAYKLLIEEEDGEDAPGEIRDFWEAVRIIVLADLVMSLDNILAVGGASGGNLTLMIFGLLLSIPLVLFGSSLLASLLNRFPVLAYVGSGILAWTAGRMVMEDEAVKHAVSGITVPYLEHIVPFVATVIVLGAGYLASRRMAARVAAKQPDEALAAVEHV